MRAWVQGVTLLLILLLVTGCWNRRELNDLGVVVGVGVDLTEDGMLEVTMAVALAQGGTQSQDQGGAGGQEQSQRTKVILRETGKTFSEAIRLAELTSPRRLALHHVQVVVLGERLAEQGVDLFLDHLLRSNQIRLTSQILLLRGGSLDSLFAPQALMEDLQSEALREMGESRAGLQITLKDYFIARTTPHKAVLIPVVTIEPHSGTEPGAPATHPRLSGAAIFAGDKVATYLTSEQTRGLLWLWRTARYGVLTVECPGHPGKYISARVARSKRQVQPAWNGRRLSLEILMSGTLYLSDLQCPLNLMEQQTTSRVERLFEQRVEDRVTEVLEILQREARDPLGLGELVRTQMPGVWHIVGRRWEEHFAEADLRVRAKLILRNLQMTDEPPIDADR